MATALEQLEAVFTEETFTRKPLINYSVNYFTELYEIFLKTKEEGSMSDMIEIAELNLSRNAQHIVSLYIMGLVNLDKKNLNDKNFERLINVFKNIKKWNIVEYLSNIVLNYYDSEYALKALANYYQAMNKDNEAIEVWEKLVALDKENYELAERIAHAKEKEGNLEEALKYYKMVFEHNLEKRRDKVIEASFKKILELNADCVSYFIRYESQIADILEADTMIDLWKIVFFHYFENKNYEKALKTIKYLLQYEQAIVKQNNKKAKYFRHRLVDVYNALYPNHSLFKQIEQTASLTNVFKEPKSVIELFERYIKYDKGKYVHHREFGIGIITDINTDNVFINFVKLEEVRKMTFEMAIKSLIALENDDILVYKAYKLPELKNIAENSPNDLITMILKYRDGGTISSKDLKHELIPDIIDEACYNKWLDMAKKSVRANNTVKFEKNTFVYNVSSLSYDEEMLIKFNNERAFTERYEIYIEYRDYTKDIKCDEARQMYEYFVDIAKDKNSVADERIVSIMFIKSINMIDSSIPTVDSIIDTVANYTKVYEALPISQYKESYINSIYKNIANPSDIINKFLYTAQVKYHNLIIDKLVQSGKTAVLEKTIDDIILKNREYTESFIFFAQNLLDKNSSKLDNGKEIQFNKTFVISGLLSLISHLSRLSDKKESSVSARKMLKVVYHLLFEKDYLLMFILENDEEHVHIVFDEFQKLIDLENHYKTEINTAIARKFPNMI